MRKAALRNRRRSENEDDDQPVASRPWWWRMLLRRPRDSVASLVAVASVTAIVVNGVYLQHGRHPAPIFALRPLPVAAAAASDVVGVVARPRQAAREAPRRDVVPAHARPDPAENARAAPSANAAPRADAIADLLATHPAPAQAQPPVHQAAIPPAPSRPQPSRQVLAIQRTLSEFGYGQLKPTGLYDADTRAAVQRFERDHNLPVTDEITEPMKRALANLAGRALE